jgi:hypothetical protein
MESRLNDRLQRVRRRFQRLRYWQTVGIVSTAAALLLGLLWLTGTLPELNWTQGITVFVAIAVLACTAALVTAFRAFSDVRSVAARIESAFPELHQRLLAAIDQRPDADGRYTYLQRRLFDSASRHDTEVDWSGTVDPRVLRSWSLVAILSTGFVASVLWMAIGRPQGMANLSDQNRDPGVAEMVVEPGDQEIERGTSLMITAEFPRDQVPGAATLVVGAEGDQISRPMKRNLDDPMFAAFLPEVDQSVPYHIDLGQRKSVTYQLTVFEFPRMVRCDALIEPPSYTGRSPETIEDTIRIAVPEGTSLTWRIDLNKPVATANLISADGEIHPLRLADDSSQRMMADFVLGKSQSWKLQLIDDRGRENKFPVELVARVLPNNPPKLELASAGDAVLSPIEEFPVSATVADDFGINRIGLVYTIGNGESREIDLTSLDAPDAGTPPATASKSATVTHLMDLEAAGAEADQLVSYHFWAEDVGTDGNPRRVDGDIFFAEVRPFEQIFREGSSPGGASPPPSQAQQQQAEQAAELGELQKQIVAATWNLIRRADLAVEIGDDSLANELVPDVNTVLASQQDAIEQLAQLTENLPPDRSPELVDMVAVSMASAVESYRAAVTSEKRQPLSDAMVSARNAYQGLLKLRAREFDIVQQQQQQQQQGGQGASRANMQRQLDQLELENDPNRYEQEKTAQPNEMTPAQAASAVLATLEELARRQADLNEQIKQADIELQQAESEKQREEILRKLERLREQQQELLRDADDLISELSETAGDPAAQRAAEQLEQTRENVRQSEQALGEQQPSQAVAAGSRAERSLEELKEDYRRESAAAIGEQMKQLRQQSEQLAREQQEINDQLAEIDQPDSGPGLRAEGNSRERVAENLSQQAVRTAELLEDIRQTVRESEQSQPLLATQLYEAQAEAQSGNLVDQLAMATELLKRGFDAETKTTAADATAQIEQLDRRLQAAAESILGDPTESLARARDQLNELAEQLDAERPQPDPDGQPSGAEAADGRPANGQSSEGQSSEGQPSEGQPSEGQPSEGQPSEGQPSEGQPNQGQPNQGQPNQGQSSEGQSSESGSNSGQGQPSDSGQEGGSPARAGDAPRGGRRSASDGAGNPAAGEGGLLQGMWTQSITGESQSPPITGDGFREWTQRLGEVEQMLSDSELRGRAAAIRDRARELRRDVTRRSRQPQWAELEDLLVEPLRQLQIEVNAELLRRNAERNATVPMDRDPVPNRFSDAVRQYYERVGAGR